ncbi:hypothetical protein BDZ94DRAFT_1308227 [Collybia nuda]|uniref:Uncharacterized protein n=1 Tax=Collybia nuda TaxID=64659 RepID=A0A9P6CFJ9_9AGAR|nr:hypothetical protein BDZ94DRAFT_1308227 [Collybia nuda]
MSFYRILLVQAATITFSISQSVDMAANEFIVRRNLDVDDDNDNGSSVSHKVMQDIVVVLVLFLLFLFALFLFRKHRMRRLRHRFRSRPHSREARISQTFSNSSAQLMSEVPIVPPPALLKNTYRTEGRYHENYSSRFATPNRARNST